MNNHFSYLDWGIFFSYFLILAVTAYIFSSTEVKSSRQYFTNKNTTPLFAVTISIIATSQSAATFLGVPEFSYLHNFTFIGFYFSSLLAILFINRYFIPKFYTINAVTVYELLQNRYGENAKKQAGIMFLLGRILASGARLYIGSLAVSMILFLDISFLHMFVSISILLIGALAYTYYGGIKSVIYSDIIQAVTYIGSALLVLWFLYNSLDNTDIMKILQENHKLDFITVSNDSKFNIFSLFGGWLLLNIAAFGLDQDMAQRVLSCKNKNEASKSLLLSIIITIPIVLLFLSIGALLYLHYNTMQIEQNFHGQSITVFMYYILNEMPSGLKGLVTVGAIAAALSSTNSVLGAMSSVAIEDIYKPYKLQQEPYTTDEHFLKASRVGVLIFALILLFMALISYLWQQHTDLSLIGFALSVMSFAYAGLLGLFFSAVFTNRGTSHLVPYSLIGGFLTVLILQPYIFPIKLSFSWQMIVGTIVSFSIMQIKKTKP